MEAWSQVNDLAVGAEELEIPFVTMSASSSDMIEEFRHEVQAAYPFYFKIDSQQSTLIKFN